MCPTSAISFGDRDEMLAEAKRRIAENPTRYVNHVYGEHEAGGTNVFHLSSVPFGELGYEMNLPNTAMPDLTHKVMRFVPKADREGMTVERMKQAWEVENREEIERIVANLRANLDNPIEVVGDRATMPYGERFRVQFVREDGVWRIEDPDY